MQLCMAAVDTRRAETVWVGNYLTFDSLRSDDVVSIEFLMVEDTVVYAVSDGEYIPPELGGAGSLSRARYRCHFKGNTFVDISPHPETAGYPIYHRDHYKANQVPMCEVTRYISSELISW